MNSDESSPSLTVLKQIDSICESFERAWKSGAAPRIEAYLSGFDLSKSAHLFEQLLRAEHSLRRDSGESPLQDEYRRRFPSYEQVIDAVFRETETRADTRHDPAKQSELGGFPKAGDRMAEFEILDDGKEGASGRVYRAWQHNVGREVALKVTRSESHDASKLARLDGHPNIVRIYDQRRVGEFYIVFMEFADGVTLRERISQIKDGGRPENWAQQVAAIGAQLGDALEFVHQKEVLHLDVKPANIVLASSGQVKLLDFNTALQTDSDATRFGGTRPYMSPEQLDAYDEHDIEFRIKKVNRLDGRSDIYSLGLVLWELATGKRPNASVPVGNEQGMLSTSVNLPPALRQVLLKCLHPEPNDRYQSAGDLAHDLRLSANIELQALLHPPERCWRSLALNWQFPFLFLFLLGVAGNAVVSAISISWNLVVSENSDGKDEFTWMAIAVNSIMYVVGAAIGIHRAVPVTVALRALQQGTIDKVSPVLISRCLHLGHFVAMTSLILWGASAIVWFMWGLGQAGLSTAQLILFSLSVLFFGGVAAPLIFFPMTCTCVRLFIPRMIRKTYVPLSDNVDRRLSRYFVLLPGATVVVLLCVFLVEWRMGAIEQDFPPLLIALLLLGCAGSVTAVRCSQAVRTDMKLLSMIARPVSGQPAK